MKYLSLMLVLLLNGISVVAQTYSNGLRILNPKQGNGSKSAAYFETTEVTITPMGIFSKIDIVGEVSARYSALQQSKDSLEIEYKFSLPAGSIIHEVYLWMNNIPVRAELYEKGRAQFIYESLVNRRIDPIIVYQTDAQSFEARIFPVLNPSSRKYQISILTPNIPTQKGWKLPLNLEMFKSDLSAPHSIQVHVVNNTRLGTPSLEGMSGNFTTSGSVSSVTIPINTQTIYNTDAIYFHTNAEKQFYTLEATDNPNEWYYELALEDSTASITGRKVMFAIDYTDNSTTELSYFNLLTLLRSRMLGALNETDSFMVMHTKHGAVSKAASTWIQASYANIQATLNTIISPYNTIQITERLLDSAVCFLNDNGASGKILVISNSKMTNGSLTSLNQKISTLLALRKNPYEINVLDVNNQATYQYLNSQVFYNNQYMLSSIANLSGGIYFKRFKDNIQYYYDYPRLPLPGLFDDFMNTMEVNLDYSFLHLTSSGAHYSDYKLNNAYNPKVNERHLEVGRYQGTPTQLAVAKYSSFNGQSAIHNYTLTPVTHADSVLKRGWGKELLFRMDALNTSNVYTTAIVNKSIEHHVLCEYTAFLALEPDTIASNISNGNPTGITPDVANSALHTTAYPNPFVDQVTFTFKMAEMKQGDKWKIEVCNLLGQVMVQAEDKVNIAGEVEYSLQMDKTLPAGMYIARITVGNHIAYIRITKQ
jgi:hypothetical protein